jgi:hypothetical protein
MTVAERLAAKICPACLSSAADIRPDFISCRTCGVRGNPHELNWCERVPIFRRVAREDLWIEKGQLYKYHERWFVLEGYAEGCGRVIAPGDFCHSCRWFMPEISERPQRKKKKAVDGKAAAAGDEVVV